MHYVQESFEEERKLSEKKLGVDQQFSTFSIFRVTTNCWKSQTVLEHSLLLLTCVILISLAVLLPPLISAYVNLAVGSVNPRATYVNPTRVRAPTSRKVVSGCKKFLADATIFISHYLYF